MALFGFGFNQSDQQATSSGQGENFSLGESFGSSFNQGSNVSSSSSFQNPQTIWGPQAGYLQQLYGMGSNLAQGGMGPGQSIFNTAQGGFNQLMNPGVNPQLGVYMGDVQRNLQRNLLPMLEGGAGMAGQMGQARHQLGKGLAISDSNQQITDMAANLYTGDMNRMMTTMAQAPMLANLGMGLPWYNAQQFAGLLGAPTVLGGASGSQSQSVGSSIGGSSDYGYNQAYGYNQNQSQSTGSSFGLSGGTG